MTMDDSTSLRSGGTSWNGRALAYAMTIAATILPTALLGQEVDGIVFDEDSGAPVTGATISFLTPSYELVTEARSDRTGRFSVRLERAGPFIAIAEHPSFAGSAPVEVQVASDQRTTLMLSLRATSPGAHEGGVEVAGGSAGRGVFIYGQVSERESRNPISNVQVTLEAAGRTTSTGANGRFLIEDVAPGTTSVRFDHLSYATNQMEVDLEPGMGYRLTALLGVQPLEVEGVEVAVQSRQVARRLAPVLERVDRASGSAHFFTEQKMRARGSPPVGSLLQGLPSAEVQNRGFNWDVRFRGAIQGCRPVVYVDGIRVSRSDDARSASEWLAMSTEEVALVEVYPSISGLPPEFNDPGTMCAIGIWTKRGG